MRKRERGRTGESTRVGKIEDNDGPKKRKTYNSICILDKSLASLTAISSECVFLMPQNFLPFASEVTCLITKLIGWSSTDSGGWQVNNGRPGGVRGRRNSGERGVEGGREGRRAGGT